MGKIRRGGFVFVFWAGDHSPRHVHVYKDGKLVTKWDLENETEMKGKASSQIRSLIAQLRTEGKS